MLLAPKTKLTKGKIGGKSFQFNPASFSDDITVTYNALTSAGITYPIPVYGGGEVRQISFDLMLSDKFEKGITKAFIAHLHSFLPQANAKGSKRFVAPKKLKFAFGWFVKDCYLASLQTEYTEFSPTLEPWGATVRITLTIEQ